jgi:phospholipid/cholesterol/gamma-HCH transport system ATP-binding protein
MMAVELQHVTKSYSGRRVLDDVSFAVPPASATIILGRSGTGKSVTLRHIIGLVKPDGGRVLIEGNDIGTMSRAALRDVRQRIGFLFQNAALFDSISVGENVAFPLRRNTKLSDGEIKAKARERLAEVGLEREFDRMPAALSGGMRKRAGLARAMALDPPLLLVDEPSAGLDPITADEIDDLLLTQKRDAGKTLVVVTHNIASMRKLADRVIMLHEGHVIADGTVEDLQRSDHTLVRAFLASENAG